jgi:CDP-glucose 4,6-dehydratase
MSIHQSDAPLRRAFSGRRVLVTGHTGFKGGWLSLWLSGLGANVTGVSLPAPEGPSFFAAVGLDKIMDHRIGDIRSPDSLAAAAGDVDAEIVIHMAAQALVRKSYQDPADTYLTNVVGTANVLDLARRMPSLRAIIVVTSDKCYENREWLWGYRENDAMGGADPYSSSKGCAELLTAAYRQSYFSGPSAPLLASVRAGNVIGGGDWNADRLVPDIVRAAAAGTPVEIRNPRSIRPWQHVLEPLRGYLLLAERMLSDERDCAEAWNFGPGPDSTVEVAVLANAFKSAWGRGGPEFRFATASGGPHEAGILKLDSTKSRIRLGWEPRLSLGQSVELTVEWYRTHAADPRGLRRLSEAQIGSQMSA